MAKINRSNILIVLFIAIGASCHWTAARGATLYVALNGLDTHPGTQTQPFATIQRAQQAVRELTGQGLSQNILVLIRPGTYWIPNGLQFGPEDGGTADHRVTYQAEGNEPVSLIGGVRINEWQRHAGQVYVAPIHAGAKGSQLFEADQRLTLARAPNEGYFHMAGPATQGQYLAFEYRPAVLDPTGWDLAEAQVNIWPEHNWFNFNYKVRSLEPNTHTIVLDTAVRKVLPDNRYAIQNVLAILDRPGECCILQKTGFVYAWPTTGEAGLSQMILATADSVIRIRGQQGQIVRNLHFQGLDIGICQGNAVEISLAEDCSIRSCKIENAGKTGVSITDHAQRIEVYGNLIRWHGQDGVSMQGRSMGREDVSRHNRIENNHIHHCGRLIGHGCGVYLYQSGFNQVLNNHIHHMPRYGTTIKGNRYGTVKGQIPGMTWDNRYDFMYGRNNRIAFNDIHHTNLDSQDTGAMESWGPGRDNQYDHNLIHDTGNTEFDLQSGIYLDDQSDYFTVTSNIIYGVVGTRTNQCIYAKGIGNRIENNVFICSPMCDTGIRSFFMADERCDQHTYIRNILSFEAGLQSSPKAHAYAFVNWSNDRVTASDYNLLYNPNGRVSIQGGPANGSWDTWRQILDRRFDQHSVVADPLFLNPATHDYRLQEGSPALGLGFQPIDTSQIGLKPDFPSRFERE